MGRKQMDDPDRIVIPEAHFSFYYQKYFKKQISPRAFSVANINEVLSLVKDTIELENGSFEPRLAVTDESDLTIYIRATEDARRERQARIDAGDETAKLQVSNLAVQQLAPVKPPVR